MIEQPHIERRAYRIHGFVQGVGFRAFVKGTAERLGLKGWVRNAPDPRIVEAVAEGSPDRLDRLEQRLRSGPPGAQVDRLEILPALADEVLVGFEVRR